jgi:hypothetical protein
MHAASGSDLRVHGHDLERPEERSQGFPVLSASAGKQLRHTDCRDDQRTFGSLEERNGFGTPSQEVDQDVGIEE